MHGAVKRSRSSGRGVKRVADPPERIVAESPICWFASGGGMRVKCHEQWSKRR